MLRHCLQSLHNLPFVSGVWWNTEASARGPGASAYTQPCLPTCLQDKFLATCSPELWWPRHHLASFSLALPYQFTVLCPGLTWWGKEEWPNFSCLSPPTAHQWSLGMRVVWLRCTPWAGCDSGHPAPGWQCHSMFGKLNRGCILVGESLSPTLHPST